MGLDGMRRDWWVYALATSSWLASSLLHSGLFPERLYSDAMWFWWRSQERVRAGPFCAEAFFEYPPLACFMVWLSMLVGGAPEAYYWAFSALSLPAFLLLAWAVRRIALEEGRGWAAIPLILSPSLLVYGVYNFDHFFAALIASSLILLRRGRLIPSAVGLGLASAVKLLSFLLIPQALIELRGGRRGILYLALFAAAAGPFYAAQLALRPHWLSEFLNYHAMWGLENSWFIWIVGNSTSPSAKLLSVLLAGYLLLKSYVAPINDLYRWGFITLSSYLLSAYVFTPQMVLWLLPLIPSLPTLAVLTLLPPLELSNVAIILTWFGGYDPLRPSSPPQTFALIRAAALAALLLYAYHASGCLRKNRATLRLGREKDSKGDRTGGQLDGEAGDSGGPTTRLTAPLLEPRDRAAV